MYNVLLYHESIYIITDMLLNEFLSWVKTGKALGTDEIHALMGEMSEEARRVTFRLNSSYHTPEEVRELLSELFGYKVPESLRVFPPFYSDSILF